MSGLRSLPLVPSFPLVGWADVGIPSTYRSRSRVFTNRAARIGTERDWPYDGMNPNPIPGARCPITGPGDNGCRRWHSTMTFVYRHRGRTENTHVARACCNRTYVVLIAVVARSAQARIAELESPVHVDHADTNDTAPLI